MNGRNEGFSDSERGKTGAPKIIEKKKSRVGENDRSRGGEGSETGKPLWKKQLGGNPVKEGERRLRVGGKRGGGQKKGFAKGQSFPAGGTLGENIVPLSRSALMGKDPEPQTQQKRPSRHWERKKQ